MLVARKMSVEKHETIIFQTREAEIDEKMIRTVVSEQESIAIHRAFQSFDHNPQFLCVFPSQLMSIYDIISSTAYVFKG